MSESVKDLIEIPSSFFKESTHVSTAGTRTTEGKLVRPAGCNSDAMPRYLVWRSIAIGLYASEDDKNMHGWAFA